MMFTEHCIKDNLQYFEAFSICEKEKFEHPIRPIF